METWSDLKIGVVWFVSALLTWSRWHSLKANDQSSELATRMCLQCISVDGTELLADQLVSISPAFNQYQHCALNLLCNYPELAQQWAADQIINITLRGSAWPGSSSIFIIRGSGTFPAAYSSSLSSTRHMAAPGQYWPAVTHCQLYESFPQLAVTLCLTLLLLYPSKWQV